MTPRSPRRWGAAHLLAAWILYWIALAAVVLWRPALVAWRMRGLAEGRANASLSFGDGGFDGKMVIDNATVWHGHAAYGTVLLWLVVPPLLLFLAWVAARPRRGAVRRGAVRRGAARPAELGAGDPLAAHEAAHDAARRERERARREPPR